MQAPIHLSKQNSLPPAPSQEVQAVLALNSQPVYEQLFSLGPSAISTFIDSSSRNTLFLPLSLSFIRRNITLDSPQDCCLFHSFTYSQIQQILTERHQHARHSSGHRGIALSRTENPPPLQAYIPVEGQTRRNKRTEK